MDNRGKIVRYTLEELRARRNKSRTNWQQAEEFADQVTLDEEDAPELTEEIARQLHPASEVLPEILGEEQAAQLLEKNSHPLENMRKELISVYLSHYVLERFRASGPGWEMRMDEALKEWLQTHQVV